ncbi:double zinc ribbon domain-containing protein [Pontixanthobacter sp.]|uniref:double zinc ribbon domain-containing protein n=1 Tax=Pontixanthobacter sp. TaxID=2792078 RepID=UPI003C7986F4
MPSRSFVVLAEQAQARHDGRVQFRQVLIDAVKPAVDLVYPPRCPLCGTAIAQQKGLCAPCWSELIIPGEPCCTTCQRPFPADYSEAAMVCGPCMADPPRHDGIAAGTLYNHASRALVLSFKHGRRIALSRMLAPLIIAQLPQLEGEWLVVPVPLHWSRLWYRGFNQAALLAEHIAKATGQTLLVDGLRRTRRTQPLGGLGRKGRERMLSGSIRLHPRKSDVMKAAQVILVDDVLTSGATSDACVKALKRGGAKTVKIACFSRVLDEARGQNTAMPETKTPEA